MRAAQRNGVVPRPAEPALVLKPKRTSGYDKLLVVPESDFVAKVLEAERTHTVLPYDERDPPGAQSFALRCDLDLKVVLRRPGRYPLPHRW